LLRYSSFLLVLFIFCFPHPVAAEDFLSSHAKIIRIAGDNHFPPFEYISSSDVYTGFNVDVMNAVSLETGIQIEFHPLPWDEALKQLHEGKVDMIQGMKYSPIRNQIYAFSDPYFTTSQGIFVLKNNEFIHQLTDLKNKSVAIQRGDIASDVVRKVAPTDLRFAENQGEAIRLLLDHKVDAFIGNRVTGQYFLQKMGRAEEVKIVGDSIESTNYAAVVMPNHKDILDIWNKGLKKIEASGTYDKIENKWFGEYIMPYSWDKVVRILRYVFILFVGVVISILWWNISLKRQVKKRTAELEEASQFKQQLLDSAYSSFITLDPQGRVSLINRNALEDLQVSTEIKNKPIWDTPLIQFIPQAQIEECLKRGTTFDHLETTWDHIGKTRYYQYNVFPIPKKDVQIIGVIINFKEITAQKKWLERIQREDRLRSLGQLVSGVAHEIRNPLMSISTYTQLLAKKIDSPSFRDAFVEQVPAEIERLNQVVTDLVDFARPKKAQPVLTNLHALIESIRFLFHPKQKGKNLRVQVDVDSTLYFFGDPGQIKQILINMMMNALDATTVGKTIQLRAYVPAPRQILIEIQDEGPGMPPEIADKVFEPFFTTKVEGVGLGLSICHQLVKENHGFIDFETSPGKGSLFRIYLQAEGWEAG
jgi:signal transduction histidine kinase/ABC-type amino acid transport substrate-binding protein